jgi:hypothetical protein
MARLKAEPFQIKLESVFGYGLCQVRLAYTRVETTDASFFPA